MLAKPNGSATFSKALQLFMLQHGVLHAFTSMDCINLGVYDFNHSMVIFLNKPKIELIEKKKWWKIELQNFGENSFSALQSWNFTICVYILAI